MSVVDVISTITTRISSTRTYANHVLRTSRIHNHLSRLSCRAWRRKSNSVQPLKRSGRRWLMDVSDTVDEQDKRHTTRLHNDMTYS